MRNDFEDALAAIQKEVWHTATIDIPNLKALINESAGGVDVSALQTKVEQIETSIANVPTTLSQLSALKPKLVPVLIYDKSSQDTTINMGLTSGIKVADSVTSNFSLYRSIKVTLRAATSGNICEKEFPIGESEAAQNFSFMFPCTRQGWSSIFLQLSADKQILTFSANSYYSTEMSGNETTIKYQNTTSANYGVIEKIEGYLKF